MSLEWITAPDANVSVDTSAHGLVGSYSHSAGVFTAEYTRASNVGGVTPSGTNQFIIQLPAGYTYTGNTRLTLLTNTEFGPYVQIVFTQIAFSPPLATGEYLANLGALAAGDFIYCPAGMDDGSGGLGVLTFTLEFEAEPTTPPPPGGGFWTDFANCREI